MNLTRIDWANWILLELVLSWVGSCVNELKLEHEVVYHLKEINTDSTKNVKTLEEWKKRVRKADCVWAAVSCEELQLVLNYAQVVLWPCCGSAETSYGFKGWKAEKCWVELTSITQPQPRPLIGTEPSSQWSQLGLSYRLFKEAEGGAVDR